MTSPEKNHNRNISMDYDGATGASAKKQVAKKNLSKFIKPYTKNEKAMGSGSAIVVGSTGGVKIQHLINTNPDE
jgi:hypothetical protein